MYKNITALSHEIKKKRDIFKKRIELVVPNNNVGITVPHLQLPANSEFLAAFAWGFNGFLLELGKEKFIIDPGYDFLSRCIGDTISLAQYDNIIISHAHVDHYASFNPLIEAITFQQKHKTVHVYAPKKVFTDRVLGPYHSNYRGKGKKQVVNHIFQAGEVIRKGEVLLQPVKLFHTISGTYGCIMLYKNLSVGYISDTGYTHTFKTERGTYNVAQPFEGDTIVLEKKRLAIQKAFAPCNILIINVNDFVFNKHSKYHLSGYDVIDIVKHSSVKACYITHVNNVSAIYIPFLREFENTIQKATGVYTHCMRNGDTIDLSKYIMGG